MNDFDCFIEEIKEMVANENMDSYLLDLANQKIDEFVKIPFFDKPFTEFERELELLESLLADINPTEDFRQKLREKLQEFEAIFLFEHILVTIDPKETRPDHQTSTFYRDGPLEKAIINWGFGRTLNALFIYHKNLELPL